MSCFFGEIETEFPPETTTQKTGTLFGANSDLFLEITRL